LEVFFQIALLHLFAVASPGPDFILILRQSFRYEKKISIYTSLGIGLGVLLHSLFAIMGVSLILVYNEFLFTIFKVAAIFYLLFLGFRSIFQQSKETTPQDPNKFLTLSKGKAFLTGLITNLSNPKAFLFFIAIFTLIGIDLQIHYKIMSGVYMSVATFIWFSIIAITLDSSKKISKIHNYLPFLESFTGLILVIIALRILFKELII